MHANMHAYMNTLTHMRTTIYTYTHTCMRGFIHACLQRYIHACIQTYIISHDACIPLIAYITRISFITDM